jgi:glycosyltransferase involved in cell wall biosynthesis
MISDIYPLVSILINNYNYGSFLREAIDSALNQTYPKTEVIVVDDGSTDNSREVIASYGDKIIPVLKENGGQASAFNAGYAASRGDILCFLDSDDIFYPNKLEVVCKSIDPKNLKDKNLMVYHLLEIIDKNGKHTGYRKPKEISKFPPNRYDYVLKYRYPPHDGSPTSGLSLTKSMANIIFPLPEENLQLSADSFLVAAAGVFGKVYGLDYVLSGYRIHSGNEDRFFYSKTADVVWKAGFEDKKLRVMIDDYLNNKLLKYGKKPIISFFDSLHSVYYYYYHDDVYDLIKLAFKIITWHLDKLTIKYFLLSIYLSLKILRKRLKNIII